MSSGNSPPAQTRGIYGTEHSWFTAVPGGTGITVLSLLLKTQPDLTLLQSSLHKLQCHHPILRSKLHMDPTLTLSLLIPPSPSITLRSYDLQSTAKIIHVDSTLNLTPFHIILEYEMNNNPWQELTSSDEVDVIHASVYNIGKDGGWVVVIKLHTGACDRTATVQLLRDLMQIMNNNSNSRSRHESGDQEEICLGLENYIPSGMMNKPLWARGVNMLGYSLNSFRLTNLDFVEPGSTRCSRVARLVLDAEHTSLLLEGCKSRGIKLCGVLSAAGLIAARVCKGLSDGVWEKYAVVTLIDCRKLLQPHLSNTNVGFYHSAILNTHDMQGGEELWGLATRTYKSFEDAKKSNKHFSDMADLNFLMCRAIENPGLTPSSSLRTSFMSVFEDAVIDESNENYEALGIEDYMGCASVHGVGPSVALFDTIRDGKLDCACVYPFPLHSRQQIQELIDCMKKILIDCCSSEKKKVVG